MIEINLLPEELKAKLKTGALSRAKKTDASAFILDPKKFLLLIPLFAAATIFVPVYLTGVSVVRNTQFRKLERKWQGLDSQRDLVNAFIQDNWLLSEDAPIIKNYMDKRIIWAEKLNKLSLCLPKGIWFNGISLSAKDLIIQASVFSLRKDEMSLINNFIDNLRKDALFLKNFKLAELNAVQKRTAGSYEVTDFVLVFTLKK